MGFLNRLLGKSKPDPITVLEEAVEKLRVGSFARLYRSYALEVGEHQAKFLAAAVLNGALLESPGNDDAARFYKSQRTSSHDVRVLAPRSGTFGYGRAVMSDGTDVHFGASEPRHDGAAIPEAPPVFEPLKKTRQ